MNYKVIIPFEDELYDDYILRILNSRVNKKLDNKYMERHHILPRCLGGENIEENMIWLFAQEHYFAHKLLALENINNYKLVEAWWRMCFKNFNNPEKGIVYCDEEDYALAKEQHSKSMSERMNGENNPMYGVHRFGENSPHYGKPLSEEAKKKISNSKKGKCGGKLHPMYGKHHTSESLEKMSKSHLGYKHTDEAKAKMSYQRKGGKNVMAKPVRCVETGEVFECANDAGKYCGSVSKSPGTHITSCCRGVRETIFGYHWEYVIPENL